MTGTVLIRGLGSIGYRHAGVFRSLGADVAVWPVRPRGGDANGIRLVDDQEGLRLAGRADLVVVATDTARHVGDTLAVLEAGAPRVLLEKPVAPTAPDARPLWTARGAADRVFVAAPLRAHRGFLEFRDSVQRLASPRAAHVFSQSWLPSWRPQRDYRESYSARRDEGGVLRDLVHEIDYAIAVLGDPGRVLAVLEHDGPLEMEAEQAATLLWRTPSTTVTMRLDYITAPSRRGAVVTAPNGSVWWDLQQGTVTTTDAGGTASTSSFPADLDRNAVMARQARAALALGPGSDPERLVHAGAPATLAEAERVVRLCDAARVAVADTLDPLDEPTARTQGVQTP